MKRPYQIVLIVIAIVAAIIGIRIYMVRRNRKALSIGTNLINGAEFPLKLGSVGQEVIQLQTWLNKEYNAQFPRFGIDGRIGPETLANMKKYLKRDTISFDFYQKVGMTRV